MNMNTKKNKKQYQFDGEKVEEFASPKVNQKIIFQVPKTASNGKLRDDAPII